MSHHLHPTDERLRRGSIQWTSKTLVDFMRPGFFVPKRSSAAKNLERVETKDGLWILGAVSM